jgi:hypothetical protein
MDAIAGLLDGPRARGAFLLRSVMEPPWSLRIQDEAPLTVVAVMRGEAWIVPDGGEGVRLSPGDVAVTRGPDPYTVASDPGVAPQVVIHPGQRCTTLDGEDLYQAMDLGVRTWGNSATGSATMLTGTYHMDGEVSQRLLGVVRPPRGPRAGLVQRPERPGRRPRAAHAPEQPGAPLDGGRPGRRDRHLTCRPRAPLHRARGRAADGLPHELAPDAGSRPAPGARDHDRLRRRAGGLRQLVRAERGVQARARHQPA